MKKRIILIVLVSALLCIPSLCFAEETITASTVFTCNDQLERGITVLPNGDVFAMASVSNATALDLVGYHSNGTKFFAERLPNRYCGNLCSTSDGYIIAHTYISNADMYIYKPSDGTSCKTLKVGSSCQALAIGDDGYIYNIRGVSKNNKKVTLIERAKLSTVLALSEGSTINWEKQYYPGYKALTDSGDCYPVGIAVANGCAYIVDKGTSKGYDGATSGIYKYQLSNGKLTAMQFKSDGTLKLKWLYGVALDKNGNVCVLSRNSNAIAVFTKSSVVADYFISTPGFVEDLATDSSGNLYYAYYKNNSAVMKAKLPDAPTVKVSKVSISPKSKTVSAGASFTVSAAIAPSDATNKEITFSSSDVNVASVDDSGNVTAIGCGTANIVVTSADGNKSASCIVTVNPLQAKIGSLSSGKARLTVKMSEEASNYAADSFKIGYKQKGTSKWKYVTATSSSKVIKSLKKNKQYYVKVCAIKKIGKKTYTGAWSKTLTSKKVK